MLGQFLQRLRGGRLTKHFALASLREGCDDENNTAVEDGILHPKKRMKSSGLNTVPERSIGTLCFLVARLVARPTSVGPDVL